MTDARDAIYIDFWPPDVDTIDTIGITGRILEVEAADYCFIAPTGGGMAMVLALRRGILIGSVMSAIVSAHIGLTSAQERYSPNTPTVSPYLNLFQNNRNGRFNRALPNYYSLVRPQVQQQRFNQQQLNAQQLQNQEILQLQTGVNTILRQQQTGPVVTGHSSWFENGGTRSRFLDTSTYFSRAGTKQAGTPQAAPQR